MLVVFIAVRPYRESDLDEIIKVYKSAFAEPPWNEYMKCSACGVDYSREESAEAAKARGIGCKKCDSPLKLVEFWSTEDIVEDLEFALSQPSPIVIVAETAAEKGKEIAGMTWGYRLSRWNLPFLNGKASENAIYMDEIAVNANFRKIGVGTSLGKEFIKAAGAQGASEVVIRTDERNPASMALFRKLGLTGIPDAGNPKGKVYDPTYPNRIYLSMQVE